jgi:hypothetical protein
MNVAANPDIQAFKVAPDERNLGIDDQRPRREVGLPVI